MADVETTMMSQGGYVAGLDALVLLCRMLIQLPMKEMRDYNEHLQTVAPVLTPEMYRHDGGQNLVEQRKLIDAALTMVGIINGFDPTKDIPV